jgi:hypothetical protein
MGQGISKIECQEDAIKNDKCGSGKNVAEPRIQKNSISNKKSGEDYDPL